jgi:tRNA G18 (ribose-2'-O)-methylase SpoU
LQAQHIDSIADPRVADYRDIRDKVLLNEHSLFIVEGRGNLRRLISDSPYVPRSVLLSQPAYAAMSGEHGGLDGLPDSVPIYVSSRQVVSSIAGFDIHRGCLAACDRMPAPDLAGLLAPPGRASVVVILEGLTDPDNVGTVFRNAMAFGVDAILLCPNCCDPLYRKAVRVSMGASLCLPTARLADWPEGLEAVRRAGYRVVGLDPAPGVRDLGSTVELADRVALVLGSEGPGLSDLVRARVDECLRIGMVDGFDSINVATASGIALHHLFLARQRGQSRDG